jgi:hypothetical protein
VVTEYGLGEHTADDKATAYFLFNLGYPLDFATSDTDGVPVFPSRPVMDALVDEWISFDARNREPRDETVAEYREMFADEIGRDPWEEA